MNNFNLEEKLLSFEESKEVYTVYCNNYEKGNIDVNQLKSWLKPIYVCQKLTTAKRLAKHRENQKGGDYDIICEVKKTKIYRIGTQWYGPIIIEKSSKEDDKLEKEIQEKEIYNEKLSKILDKIKNLGFSDEEISILIANKNNLGI